MKNRFLLLCLLSSGVAFAQNKPSDNFSCTAPAVSHWSLGLKAGPTFSPDFNVAYGGSLDYSINPFIGFGFEGHYLNGLNAVQATCYGSLNLLNLCSTYRTGFWKHTNLFMVAGPSVRVHALSGDVYVMAGFNAEYNFSKSFALELGTEGFFNTGKTVLTSLGIRYKFTTAHLPHARNIDMCSYIPKPATIVLTETKGRDNSEALNTRLEAAESAQSALQLKAQKLAEDLNALKNKK